LVSIVNTSLIIEMYASSVHSDLRRGKAIKDLLARSAPNLNESLVQRIIEKTQIPMAWVDEARVSQCKYCRYLFPSYACFEISRRTTLRTRAISILHMSCFFQPGFIILLTRLRSLNWPLKQY